MKFNSLEDWFLRLKSYSEFEGVFVLVEGKNDVKILKRYGINNLYPIQGKRFHDIIEELEFANLCIILTDLDKQGEKIANKLEKLFKKEGIPVNLDFRKFLKNYPFKEIEKIKL